MPLQLITYPHPTLRYRSKPIKRVDRQLKEVAAEMLDLMYASHGVGLAANQVDLPLRLFVLNPAGERGEGEELVLINPVLSRPKGTVAGEEGCLSLPGVFGPVIRSKEVLLSAFDLQGNPIERRVDGFLARILQHENDHLDGVLFIDRLSPEALRELEEPLEELTLDYQSRQSTGELPPDEQLVGARGEWEQRYA